MTVRNRLEVGQRQSLHFSRRGTGFAWGSCAWLLLLCACSGTLGVPDRDGLGSEADGGISATDPDNTTSPGQTSNAADDAVDGVDDQPDDAADPSSGSQDDATEPDATADDADNPDDTDTYADGSEVTTPPPGVVPESCEQTAQPVAPLLKLSTYQYRNTVRDVLSALGAEQVAVTVAELLDAVPDDSRNERFRGLDNRVSLEHVQGYFNVAKAAGEAITTDADVLEQVAGSCALDAALTADCASDFAQRLALLAYRRPPSEAELAELVALNDGQRTPGQVIAGMLTVALMSPRFVNHVEVDGAWVGGTDGLLRLAPYEIASKLSYTFWQSAPDAELYAAAQDGSLSTAAGLQTQLERVFEHPRTRETLWQFWREWLALESFTGFEISRPAFASLAQGLQLGEPGHDYYADMVQELQELTDLFTFDQPGTFAQLLSTNLSVTRSADLAQLYGVEPWSGSGAYPTLPEGLRAGLFQRAALLVSSLEQTNPFHRGAFVQRFLLCLDLPSPDPASLPPGSLDAPPVSGEQTTRERYQAKIEGNDLCAGCHGAFSELGYALEAFDSLGRYRSVERVFDPQNGELLAELPVNAIADVNLGAGVQTVSSPAELNQLMLASGRVEPCLVEQYLRFVQRRDADAQTSDRCVAEELTAVVKDPAAGLKAAFRSVAGYASFYQRQVGEP